MGQAEEPIEGYWDLLADVARLQAQLGEDLVAWAKAYEAAGRALQRSARTQQEVARVGRRMEAYLQTGPPAVVSQVLQMFSSPWPGLGATPGTRGSDPFTRFWQAWAGLSSPPPPPGAPDPGDRA